MNNMDYSLSDIAAATGNGNNDGFGNGAGAWWIVLFLIFAMGWRGNGFGGNDGGSNGGGSFGGFPYYAPYGIGGFPGMDGFETIQRQLDQGFTNLNTDLNQINTNVTSGFYNTNTSLLTGFGNTNLATANGFAATQRQLCESTDSINANINNNGYETRLLGVNMNSQLQQCCCDLRENLATDTCAITGAIKDTNYNMSMGNNAILQAMNSNARDIIDAQNANYRALHDEIVANRIEDKNAQIQAQQNQINALQLAASQERQNNLITQGFANEVDALYNRLSNCPVPSTPVYGRTPIFTCPSNNNGCGCGCGNF